MTLCDRGEGGSAERYVTPKIIYMYNINYNFYCYVCLCIHIYTYLFIIFFISKVGQNKR